MTSALIGLQRPRVTSDFQRGRTASKCCLRWLLLSILALHTKFEPNRPIPRFSNIIYKVMGSLQRPRTSQTPIYDAQMTSPGLRMSNLTSASNDLERPRIFKEVVQPRGLCRGGFNFQFQLFTQNLSKIGLFPKSQKSLQSRGQNVAVFLCHTIWPTEFENSCKN